MNALDTVAAQRDAMSQRNRELAKQLDAANTEIARLKGGAAPAAPAPETPRAGVGEVPKAKPAKNFRTRTVR